MTLFRNQTLAFYRTPEEKDVAEKKFMQAQCPGLYFCTSTRTFNFVSVILDL